MDPRLKPNLHQQPGQPAVPHTPAPQATPAQPPASPTPAPATHPAVAVPAGLSQPTATVSEAVTELVDAIPLHQQGQAPTGAAVPAPQPILPQNPGQPTTTAPQAPPADELEQILQAVNQRVAAPAPAPTRSKPQIFSKLRSKLAGIKPTTSNKPLVPAVIVMSVAVVLSGLAVIAYRQGNHSPALGSQPGKVGTSYTASASIQSAGGTLVRPSDFDDYSQELQTKLNSLNDSQDFAAQPLSDQTLGL